MEGYPLEGDAVVSVDGAPVELDGVSDAFARAVKLLEDSAAGLNSSRSGVGAVEVTFRTPPGAQDLASFLEEETDDEGDEGGGGAAKAKGASAGLSGAKAKGLKRPESRLELRPGLEDDEEEEDDAAEAAAAGLWRGGAPPMEVDIGDGNYAVQFTTPELHVKLMENVDRRFLPVVAKAFPGARLMARGHVLMSVNGKAVDDRRSATHEPFATALDLLAALASPPCTLEFARPPPVAVIRAVEGSPGLYDAVFEGAELGIDLGGFGASGRVVRVTGTHPVGVPHIGDQVVGVNGLSLLRLDEATPEGAKVAKDVLGHVQRLVADPAKRPLTLRLQRSSGEMAAGEEMLEARRGFSVLFMSGTLGLSFDLKTGVPVVDDVRPLFTVPRKGDVLTAINGAELSKCALTVAQLTLMLKALPRPVRLSFVDGSKSLTEALAATDLRAEGHMVFPQHHLRQVVLPAGRRVGLRLMTVSNRPVVQAVTGRALAAQGLLPCDVLVSIDGRHVGDATAVEAAHMLAAARAVVEAESDSARRQSRRVGRTRALKLGVLRMAPADKDSSYNSQHPIDVAAALTAHDPKSGVGILSFSMPGHIPSDKYKVEIYRFGNQVAPMMSGGSHERDHYVRFQRSTGVDLQQSGGRFAADK